MKYKEDKVFFIAHPDFPDVLAKVKHSIFRECVAAVRMSNHATHVAVYNTICARLAQFTNDEIDNLRDSRSPEDQYSWEEFSDDVAMWAVYHTALTGEPIRCTFDTIHTEDGRQFVSTPPD